MSCEKVLEVLGGKEMRGLKEGLGRTHSIPDYISDKAKKI